MKKMISTIVTVLSILTLLHSCDTTEPQIEKNISILEYDVAVMEAYIHLAFESKQKRNLQLFRNNKLIGNFVCNKKDTIIVDTALTESTSYKYKLKEINRNTIVAESNVITVTTLLPTSHNYTWETFTFGEHNSSALWNVAIVDENNIWAVGEVYMNDSNGIADQKPYNVVQWNYNNWEVKRIYVDYQKKPTLATLTGVFSLQKNRIILTSGLPYLYENDKWKLYHLWDMKILGEDDGGVTKIWGQTNNNVYFAGRAGTIVHYNCNNWRKIESGTKTLISDVLGIINPITNENENEIYCAVSSFFSVPGGNDKKLLKITNTNKVKEINWDTDRNVATVWTKSGFPIYAGGDGVFENKTGSWREIRFGTNNYTNQVRGSALNNVFVVGGFGLVAHYNGITWKVISQLKLDNGNYVSISIRNNIVAITGFTGSKAIIVIGKPN